MGEENPSTRSSKRAILEQRKQQQMVLHQETKLGILAFYLNEQNQKLVDRTSQNIYDSELWYELFRQVFGRYTRSDCFICNIVAAWTRLCGRKTVDFGQEDPLWEKLFDKHGRAAFRAQAWAIRERERSLNIPRAESSAVLSATQSTVQAA